MYIAQKLRLGKYLGANIVAWGILLTLHVLPNSFGAFFAMRFLLGMNSITCSGSSTLRGCMFRHAGELCSANTCIDHLYVL